MLSEKRMNDEELISAYVDGRMSEPERAAFETRLQANAVLRRQVAVTRLLVDQSRQVENVAAPKNFILPQDFGKATQPAAPSKRFDWQLLFFRFGSVAAALVFVFAVTFDALSSTPPALPAAAPMAAQPAATSAPEAAISTNIEPVTATLAPEQTSAAGAAMLPASPPMTQARTLPAEAMTTMQMTITVAPLDAVTEVMTESLPDAASAKSMPAPQTQNVETQNAGTPEVASQPQPFLTPLRIVAAVALLLAFVLGIAGWLRR